MKLSRLANFVFSGLCALSMAFQGSPALAEEDIAPADNNLSFTPATDNYCPNDPRTYRDENSLKWIRVDTMTRDGLKLSFDLHFDLAINGIVNNYINVVCDKPLDDLYHKGATIYAEKILQLDYEDLPEQAVMINDAVMNELNHFLETIMIPGSSAVARKMRFENVKAPGLLPVQGRMLLQKGLNFDYGKQPNPASFSALSWDLQQAHYKISIDYEAKNAAYQIFGPDDEGIRRYILMAAQNLIKQKTRQRRSDCLEPDMKYITGFTQKELATTPAFDQMYWLFNIKVTKLEREQIDPDSLSAEQRAALLQHHPAAPRCIEKPDRAPHPGS